MTLQLKKIDVNDRDTIRSLLIESWDTICTDISLIDNTLFRGEEVVCDLVGIDQEKRLAFGFIKMAEQKDSITSLFNSCNWVRENLYIISKIYSKFPFNTSGLPSVFFISPSFSSEFIKTITYFDIDKISLYRFLCIEIDRKRGIVLERVGLPAKQASLQNEKEVKKPTPHICLNCLGLSEGEKEDLLSF